MNTVYFFIVCIIGIILFFLIYIEPVLLKHKVKNSNEYGSARFSTFKEIEKNFKKETINNLIDAGFPVWYSNNYKDIYFDRETPHYVYLGSTGSGKSVTAVIPTCTFLANAKNKRSVFITDPKGEIFFTTSGMFKKNGYEIICIDFRNPEYSNKINLLDPIINEYEKYMYNDDLVRKCELDIIGLQIQKNNLKEAGESNSNIEQLKNINLKIELLEKEKINYQNDSMKHFAETNRLISSLSGMIMTDKLSKDPFWNNSARNLLEGLIALFLEDYKDGKIDRSKITLTSIKKFQNSSMDEENFLILQKQLEKKQYGCKSKDSLTSIFSSAENTYKSITATFSEKMSLFDDVNVANITSESNFDFNQLGTKPTALYVIVPDEDKTYYTLITIIVGLLYRELVKLANENKNKKLPVQIDWLLDEFANCPPLADIEAIVSVARSRGMRFQFFIQSFSQLDNVYGKEVAQIILDNCGLVYLKTNTQETAEAISKRLGKKTIESSSISQSMSKLDYNGNKSTSLMGRDLLTPEEVKQLHYKTIIFPIIGYPIFRDTVVYDKFSCYSSGVYERNITVLKDLSYTYHTVEDYIERRQSDKNVIDNENIFEDIIGLMQDIFSNSNFKIEQYMKDEMIPTCEIELENAMSGSQEDKIKDIDTNVYEINIDDSKKKILIYKLISINK